VGLLKILILSDSPSITTGYGVIAYGFGKYLNRAGFEVVFGSLQQMGMPVKIEIDGELFPVYSCYGGQTQYLEKTVELTRPDIAIHIRDPIVLTPTLFIQPYKLKPTLSRYGVKVLHWAPIMGEPPSEVVSALIEDSDLLLAPTEWAYNLYIYHGFPSNKMEVLRWGVDTEIYKPQQIPIEERVVYGLSPDRFVVMAAGVHDRIHKAYPILMKATSILAKKYDVELYLHTGIGSFKLDHYVDMLGLRGRVVIPAVYIKDWGIPFEDMAKLYNLVDVVCSPSTLEGANMILCEALACGKPIVASELPVHVEMTMNGGLYAPIVAEMPDTTCFMQVTTAEKIAEQLEKVIEGWRPNQEFIEAYRRWISWELRVREFIEILENHPEISS
jgi:glycosyltransferase involved in cell wall biosynthesis